MTHALAWFRGRTLVIQLGALLFACVLLANVTTVLIIVTRFGGPDPLRVLSVATIKAGYVATLVDNATPEERDIVLRLATREGSDLFLVDDAPIAAPSVRMERLVDAVRRLSPTLGDSPQARDERTIGIAIGEGRALVAAAAIDPWRAPVESTIVIMTLGIAILSFGFGTIWLIRSTTSPIRRLSETVGRFAETLDSTPLPRPTSAEMRVLTEAIDAMRLRIRALVDDRSRMLAAVGHDLRTPLTRVRLRIEAQPPGEERTKSLKDLAAMDKMIGQALLFLRDQLGKPKLVPIDVASLVSSLCDDFEDSARPVTYTGLAHATVLGDADMLTRAFSNLIENAVKFGDVARVKLALTGTGQVAIAIEDDGPGIAEADRARVLEPFERADAARATSGFGLGLSIAKQVVASHRGKLGLENRDNGGFVAIVELPLHRPLPKETATHV